MRQYLKIFEGKESGVKPEGVLVLGKGKFKIQRIEERKNGRVLKSGLADENCEDRPRTILKIN